MIGPHFGQSRDYDEFILGLAPSFWAFLAALMRKHTEAVDYIATQCKIILAELEDLSPNASFFTALWLLNIASAGYSNKQFEFARSFINDRGGISETILYRPPSSISLGEDYETKSDRLWISELQKTPVKVPDMREFVSNLKIAVTKSYSEEENALHLAFEVLLDPEIHVKWAPRIKRILAS